MKGLKTHHCCNDFLDKILEIYSQALKREKIQRFLEFNLKHHYHEIPKEKKSMGSLLETKMRTALKKMGLKFIEQAQSKVKEF